MVERIKETWQGHVKSSEGYSFWILNRGSLQYRDEGGPLLLNSEWLIGAPGTSVLIWLSSIPDTDNRPRSLVVDRIRRGAVAAGWQVEFVD